MQSALLPKALCNKIDRIIWRFLWGDSDEMSKVHLVIWETITRLKEHGGLGIKSMHGMKLAFMAKMNWRLFFGKQSLWEKVLTSKYIIGEMGFKKLTQKPASSKFQHLERCCLSCNHPVEGNETERLQWQRHFVLERHLVGRHPTARSGSPSHFHGGLLQNCS